MYLEIFSGHPVKGVHTFVPVLRLEKVVECSYVIHGSFAKLASGLIIIY
jgi:hypothetical protein